MNTSDEPLRKKPKRCSDYIHEFAPGERKKATDWIREENHDTKSFPELFSMGKYGLHDTSRKRKISAVQNYSSKILNKNKKFAQNSDFIFVAQQYLERHSFENQITVSVQRGIKAPDGTNKIKSNDVVDVFKTIPGTPAYWKSYRNKIFAMMEQLGTFNFFFTLSSAEKKWPEVKVSILHSIREKISYEKGWEEDSTKIKIDGKPLPEYWDGLRNKSQYYKDQFLLITRIFDSRAKAFIQLLTASGEVSNYTYRIEFQIRGMPHVHGVFWLRDDIIEEVMDGNEFDDEKVVLLIDKWVTCSLDTGDANLDKLVSEVNIHGHTSSCRKQNKSCRFNFPRFPCKRTLIASPLSSDLTDDEKEKKLSESKEILDKVKEKLELSNDEIEKLFKNDLDLLLRELHISYEAYENALSISDRGKIVILKRTLKERYVNNYRVSHRYCCYFEVNFTKSGTRYLQKDNVLAKFQPFPFIKNQKTSKKP